MNRPAPISRPFRERGPFEQAARRLRERLSPLVPVPPRVWTFDVFDTAVTRLVLQPDHLHWLVARHARARGLTRIDADTWRQSRVAAEADARTERGGEEVTLAEIYAVLERRLRDSRAFLARMRALELELERTLSRPVAATLAAVRRLREAGGRVAFVSDTYFDADTVASILAANGYDAPADAVIASSEHGATKARGDLYEVAAASLGVTAREIAHTGDNRRSDVVNARRAGVRSRLADEAHATRYEQQLLVQAGGDDLASLIAGAARAARLSFQPGDPRTAGLVRVSTGVAAPLLTAFVLWTLDQARRDGVSRLYFLARDGQILTALANKLALWIGSDDPHGGPIECRYLLGSRQAFYLPSLSADPVEAIAASLAESHGQRVDRYLAELEIDPGEAARVWTSAGLAADTLLDAESALALRRALERSVALLTVRDRVLARSDALARYLDTEGFFDPDVKSAIVDLGWKGNLQRRLERACAGAALRGYYYDLDRLPPDLRGTTVTFANGAFRNCEILESFCMATHTSVRGFTLTADGGAMPDVDSWRDAEALAWGVETQQAAVLRFADLLIDALPGAFVAPEALVPRLRQAGLAVFAELIEFPAPDEAAVYGSVQHARGQQHEDVAEIAPRLSATALCRAMISHTYRVRLNAWMPGAVVRSQESIVGRVALALLRLRQRRRTATRHHAAATSI